MQRLNSGQQAFSGVEIFLDDFGKPVSIDDHVFDTGIVEVIKPIIH